MQFLEVLNKSASFDSYGKTVHQYLSAKGIKTGSVRTSEIYYMDTDADVRFLAELLCDSVTNNIYFDAHPDMDGALSVDITTNPGVMDPAAETLRQYIVRSGMKASFVKYIRRFYFFGLSESDSGKLLKTVENYLYNPLIEHISHGEKAPEAKALSSIVDVKSISLECDLEKLSKEMTLSLNKVEMEKVKSYFDSLGRNPTDAELETIAQTWSEHCVHKTFKAKISYEGNTINNLFRNTIQFATESIDHPDCVSVFSDNAGIFKFDDYTNLCFKVETHNHPSALEPYGGAGTGIGGVIRDIIGTGLGAKPIANTDVFCVGEFDSAETPQGTIKPEDILSGIASGVRDYGNRMGIPTVNGAVHYHKDFAGNPLVFAGSMGMMKRKNSFKEVLENDMIVLVGGRTGRDGIHGATFSSVSLNEDSQELSSGAVQIGNPIEEKKMLDAILEADGLYSAITDCGAGGLSSAVGEMGEYTGAEVFLERVPLKYEGISYAQIWISESQERMVLSVPERNYEAMKRIFDKYNSEISHIGYFRGGNLILKYNSVTVCSLDMKFLHKGIPQREMTAKRYQSLEESCKPVFREDISSLLKRVVSDRNVMSKEGIVRQYDHEVQSQTIIKPLGGSSQCGVNDAAVIMPLESSGKCIILSNGINPHYGRINPGKMTYAVIDEALRNMLAQGGDLEHTAILDNFSWGDVNKETTLGALVESCITCREYAVELGTPFISGKDSLNNFFISSGKEIEIPPTLLISAVSVADVSEIRHSYFSQAGNTVYLFGKETAAELCGTVLLRVLNQEYCGEMPSIDRKESADILRTMSSLNRMKIIKSAHDISDGGFITALLEMSFGNLIGADISIDSHLLMEEFMFSETQTRFILEIESRYESTFERAASGKFIKIGRTIESPELRIRYNKASYVFSIDEYLKYFRGVK